MNAVILAAGVGHRMISMTRQLNKALLPIGGMANIERMICHLIKAGIQDITIVVGYKQEMFYSLQKRYRVKLVYNKKYSMYNNLYSMQMVLSYLKDTFLIYGDVALFKNIFINKPKHTTIYTIFKKPKGIPMLSIESERHILSKLSIALDNERIITYLGIMYIARTESRLICDKLSALSKKQLRNYKGEIEMELLPMLIDQNVHIHQIDTRNAIDMNLIHDYYEACMQYEMYWKRHCG